MVLQYSCAYPNLSYNLYSKCVKLFASTDLFVSFNKSTYNFNEDSGVAQPELILSNPSSTDITVKVNSRDSTAISSHE